MADFDDVTRAIEQQLESQKKRIVNRNALNALVGALGGTVSANPGAVIESLRKVFVGRSEAIETGRQKIAQEAILQLVCRIDDALTEANAAASKSGSVVTVSGLVEVIARGGDRAVGASVDPSAGPVVFAPGSRIRTETHGVRNVTGLQIGQRTDE